MNILDNGLKELLCEVENHMAELAVNNEEVGARWDTSRHWRLRRISPGLQARLL